MATTVARKGSWKQGLLTYQALLLFFVVVFSGIAVASSLSVGYTTSQKLPVGTIVAPDSQQNGAVVPANSTTNNNLIGVVVAGSTVSVTQANSQVQVSTEGTNYVLVSDFNGAVKKGDKVTASPLDGIGMKATDAGRIIGTTQSDLSSQSQGAQTKTVKDTNGVEKSVLIAVLPLEINVSYYQPSESKTVVPKILRDISSSISGSEVSTGRLWASLVIILITLIIVVVLLYGAVRSSIGAIGRNPLAKNAIQYSMTKVIVLAVVILVFGSGTVYLILRG